MEDENKPNVSPQEAEQITNQIYEDNNPNKKSKAMFIVIPVVIVLVIVVCGGYFTMNYIKELKENSGIKTESNVFFDDEEAEEYLADKVSNIRVTMSQTVSCERDKDGVLMGRVNLENKNEFQYMVEFFLDDSDEPIYTTGLIPPGGKLEAIPIDKDLKPGSYPLVAVFTAISEEDNQTNLGSTGISVDMQVN